ncbi:MAG: hypothetical protein F6K35_47815 [Okeania sp. SIO2H7]|nr:hypothetical protein [Okeania sp. SIO2H7]
MEPQQYLINEQQRQLTISILDNLPQVPGKDIRYLANFYESLQPVENFNNSMEDSTENQLKTNKANGKLD